MGKALYRKHRSKSFDEVIGQKHITDTLKNALQKGAVAHAYLFTGPRGVGKTSIARILAHAINDLPYTDESTHLDIIEIDAASNRRIDEIRDLRDKVHIAPTSAKYKVYIIDEVHMLTREAFNALLKTLEEPPEHVVFILATTESHKIPDTIISRTQRFTFKPIDILTAIDHLRFIAQRENIAADDTALELIARHGNGSFRDSISMLDQLSGLAKESYGAEDVSMLLGLPSESMTSDVITSVEHNDADALFAAISTMKEQGIDINEAAKAISYAVRQQIIDKSLQIDQNTALTLLKDLLPLTAGAADYVSLELCLLSALHTSTKDAHHPVSSTLSNTQKQQHPPKPASNDSTPSHNPVTQSSTTPTRPRAHASSDSHLKPDTSIDTSTSTAPTDSAPEVTQPISEETPASKEEPSVALADKSEKETHYKPAAFTPDSWDTLLNDIKSQHNTLYGVLRMAQAAHDGERIILRFSYGFHKKRIDSPQNSAVIRKYLKKHFGNADFATTVSKGEMPSVSAPDKDATPATDTTISSVSNIFGGAELLES